jgi:hypothetical protein
VRVNADDHVAAELPIQCAKFTTSRPADSVLPAPVDKGDDDVAPGLGALVVQRLEARLVAAQVPTAMSISTTLKGNDAELQSAPRARDDRRLASPRGRRRRRSAARVSSLPPVPKSTEWLFARLTASTPPAVSTAAKRGGALIVSP